MNFSGFELDGNTRLTSFVYAMDYRGQPGRYGVLRDGHKIVIHPDSEVPLVPLRFDGVNAPPGGRFTFHYFLYAGGMGPVEADLVLET